MCSIYPILIDQESTTTLTSCLSGSSPSSGWRGKRLLRRKAPQIRSQSTFLFIFDKKGHNLFIFEVQKQRFSLYLTSQWKPTGDRLSGEVCESWAGQVLQQPEHLVNICFSPTSAIIQNTVLAEKRGWPSQVPQPTLRSDFQVSWRIWLGWPRGHLNIFWTRIGSKYL